MKINWKIFFSLLFLPVLFAFAGWSRSPANIGPSQTNSARSSLNLEGGAVEDMAISANGTIYLATNSPNGIFRSTNGGTTWRGPSGSVDMGSPANVETDPSSNAYLISGISLFKSNDNGNTWTPLTAGRGDYGQAMLYAQNKLLVASRNGSIDISDDGGNTFSNVAILAGSQVNRLASSPTAGHFYALVRNNSTISLYKSKDGGSSWSATGKNGNFDVVGVDPNDANHIVLAGAEYSYTTDGGNSWLTMSYTPHGASVGHVTFRSSDSRLYIGASFTNDNGATEWHNMQDEAQSFESILQGNAFAIDPSNSNTMYIRSGRGMAKTTDGGANWFDTVNGMTGVKVYDISQAADKDIVWLAAHGGLAKSSNFTSSSPTWSFPILPATAIDFANSVWVNPSDPDRVIAGAGTQLWYSPNGGGTWNDVTPTVSNDSFKDIEATSDNQTIYAGYGGSSGGGVVRSTNGGTRWTSTGMPTAAVNALAIDSNGSVYAGTGKEFDATGTRGIFKYDGNGWTHLGGSPSTHLINDILIVGSTIYAAAGETNQGAIFESTDGGASWIELKNGLPSDGWFKSLARESGSTSALYASTGRPSGTSYIYKSMDGGLNWGLYYTGLKDEAFDCLLFDALVGGSSTGIYNYRSKASLSLSKSGTSKLGRKALLSTILQDRSTRKPFSGRLVRIYQRVGRVWNPVVTAQTDQRGNLKAYVKLRSLRNYYYALWIRKSQKDKENYLSATSAVITVRARR